MVANGGDAVLYDYGFHKAFNIIAIDKPIVVPWGNIIKTYIPHISGAGDSQNAVRSQRPGKIVAALAAINDIHSPALYGKQQNEAYRQQQGQNFFLHKIFLLVF